MRLIPQLVQEYLNLWHSCQIRPEWVQEVRETALKISARKADYVGVAFEVNSGTLPWYIVGILHYLECNLNFSLHLHNGDSLQYRTKHEPKGRPFRGEPPFTWQESAIDALRVRGWGSIYRWDIPRILFELEEWNGFGYRLHHSDVYTPYLWSGTNHYWMGKYTQDGKFDPLAQSKQVGAAPLLLQFGEAENVT